MPETMRTAYAEKLNEAQKKALYHHKGPAMVLAGPGSGKTTVLTGRVRYLTEHLHILPTSILVITYTKAAALSMQKRFLSETSGRFSSVVFGTFHAVCYQILKEQYHLRQDCLLSEQEKLQIIQTLLKEKKHKNDTEEAELLLGFISMRKNTFSKTPDLCLPEGMEEAAFELLYHDYTDRCAGLGKMDFDDILLKCLFLFQKKQEMLKKWQSRFSYILVDEYQDCNDLQFEILKLLAGEEANLFVVGDDDQSVYGFRGANPDIMKQFAAYYPQALQIRLEANYRSREEIIKISNAVIKENRTRFPKTMYAAKKTSDFLQPVTLLPFTDQREQDRYVFARLKEMSEYFSWEDMAVIFRTNREAELFAYGLEENKIPYVLKGHRKSKYAHFTVKDMFVYLQAAKQVRKVGEQYAVWKENLQKEAQSSEKTGISRALLLPILNKPNRGILCYLLPEGKVDLLKMPQEGCLQLHKQLCRISELSPWAAISYIRKVIGYDKWLHGKAGGENEKYAEWKERLDLVQTEAKKFDNIEDWLLFVKTEREKTEGQVGEKGVQLMTMHAAKGLEFSYVCIPGANEGKMPHGKILTEQTVEEERRLFYVGITRAKTALDILYLTGTKEYPKLPSRFLNPLLHDTK